MPFRILKSIITWSARLVLIGGYLYGGILWGASTNFTLELEKMKLTGQNFVPHFEAQKEPVSLSPAGYAQVRGRAVTPAACITLQPAAPLILPQGLNTFSCWLRLQTASAMVPPALDLKLELVCRTAQETLSIGTASTLSSTWQFYHIQLSPQQAHLLENEAHFVALKLQFQQASTATELILNISQPRFYRETWPPLAFNAPPFTARPEPVAATLPGVATTGLMIPDDPHLSVVRVAQADDQHYFLLREGEDDALEIFLPTKLGNWDDLAMRWGRRGAWLQVAVDGGVYFAPDGDPHAWRRALDEEVTITSDGKSVTYQGALKVSVDLSYPLQIRYYLIGKSLIAEIQGTGEVPLECRFGKVVGFQQPQLLNIPYYTYDCWGKRCERPAVVMETHPDTPPLFFMAHSDWTYSHASRLFGGPKFSPEGIASNGGVRYLPQTDGRATRCQERLVFVLAPEFHEVLPNIPNPTSAHKTTLGTRLLAAVASNDRLSETRYWRTLQRQGVERLILSENQQVQAPGAFGEDPLLGALSDADAIEATQRFITVLQDELGYYCAWPQNFCLLHPTSAFWQTDLIARDAQAQLKQLGGHSYVLKARYAVELGTLLNPLLRSQVRPRIIDCRFLTRFAPWQRVDHDARNPEAGGVAGVLHHDRRLLHALRAKQADPLIGGGGSHFIYGGYSDGHLAVDRAYNIAHNPWLVDFDLLKLHNLCCNFGMGNLADFGEDFSAEELTTTAADRYLAATIAFGHAGMLLPGAHQALRSYFLTQALAARYTQTTATAIHYLDERGELYLTTSALHSGVYQNSQIATTYADGTLTIVNGSVTLPLKLEAWRAHHALTNCPVTFLPPNGFLAYAQGGAVRLFSGVLQGRRADLAVSPEYVYVDGHGFTARFAEGVANGMAWYYPRPGGFVEIFMAPNSELGLPATLLDVVALDQQRRIIKAAEVRCARGYSYIVPVKGAVSYLARHLHRAPAIILHCNQELVEPGERVVIEGQQSHAIFIPQDARHGERIWVYHERGWIDFTVVHATKKPAS